LTAHLGFWAKLCLMYGQGDHDKRVYADERMTRTEIAEAIAMREYLK
jgi:hypothetical protein